MPECTTLIWEWYYTKPIGVLPNMITFQRRKIFAFKGKLTFVDTRPIQGVFQVSEDQPTNRASPPRGHSTKILQQAGWFTNQEWNDLFDPHKAPPPPPPTPPPPPMPPPLPPICTPTLILSHHLNQKKTNRKKEKKQNESGLSVKTYGIKRHRPRPRDFKCPASKKCTIVSKSQRKLNLHIRGPSEL